MKKQQRILLSVSQLVQLVMATTQMKVVLIACHIKMAQFIHQQDSFALVGRPLPAGKDFHLHSFLSDLARQWHCTILWPDTKLSTAPPSFHDKEL